MKLNQSLDFSPNLNYPLREYLRLISQTNPISPSPQILKEKIFGEDVKLPIQNIARWYPYAWFGFYATRCIMQYALNGKRVEVLNLINEVDLAGVDKAISQNNGCILLGSHLGPYPAIDILFEKFADYDVRSVTSNPYRNGKNYISAHGKDNQKKALIKSLLHLRSNGIVRIATDGRIVGDHFFETEIFNQKIRLSKGPWHLISQSDSPIFWTTCSFKGPDSINIGFDEVNISNEEEYVKLIVDRLKHHMTSRPQDIGFRSGNILWHKGFERRNG